MRPLLCPDRRVELLERQNHMSAAVSKTELNTLFLLIRNEESLGRAPTTQVRHDY